MALSRAQLSDVTVVSAGSTQAIATVAGSNKVFVKSIMAHNTSGVTTTTAQVYVVPNGGSVTTSNRLFNVSVDPDETVYIEPAYPITIETTGDTVQVGAGSNGGVNFFVTGDQEG